MVDVGTMAVPRMERFRLAPDQLVAVLDVVSDPRERALIAVCLNTALRSSEVTALRIKDVDLSDGELYVVRQKSKSDDRLKITPALDRELRQWLTTYATASTSLSCWPTSTDPHQQRPDRGDQRAPRTPARLGSRLAQPHQLHRKISAGNRRLQTPTTPSIMKSPFTQGASSGPSHGEPGACA